MTYELRDAEENLAELFQLARNGEDVFIVRADGLTCQLVPVANVKEEEPVSEHALFTLPAFGAEVVPA